jgi:hypothetical protein
VPNRNGIVRSEEPPVDIAAMEAEKAAADAAAAARNAATATAAAAAAAEHDRLAKKLAGLRTVNAERQKYTTVDDIPLAAKRIKTLTVQQVIRELLQKTTPMQRATLRERMINQDLPPENQAIYDKLVAELPQSGSPTAVAVQNAAVAAVNAAVARKNLEVAKVNAAVVTPAAGPVHRGLGASFNAANAAATSAQNAVQQAEYEKLLMNLNSTPRGPWPGSQQASVAPKSFYNLPREQRNLMAAETRKQLTAQEQGPYVPAPVQPTGVSYAHPADSGIFTRAETTDPGLSDYWNRSRAPTSMTVRHQQEVKMNPWVHRGARRKTRRSKNKKTRKARS